MDHSYSPLGRRGRRLGAECWGRGRVRCGVADVHRCGRDHEHAAEIAAAHQIDLFKGYGNGTFRSDAKLTQRQAENLIWRILSWHGTDTVGNFEMTRADAAVLAMTGLCGLDGDRIPGCVELAPQAVESTRVIETPDPTHEAPDPTPAAPGTSTPNTPPSDDPETPDPPLTHQPESEWSDMFIIDHWI